MIHLGSTLSKVSTTTTTRKGEAPSVTDTWEGNEAQITAKQVELSVLGWDTQITPGAKYVLQATITEEVAVPEVIWSTSNDSYVQSLYESQRPFMVGMAESTKRKIDEKLKNADESVLFVNLAAGESQAARQIRQNKAARAYYYKMIGVDGIQKESAVLRRQANVKSGQNLGWSVTNNGYVLSTAYLIANYAPSTNLAALLSTGGYVRENIEVIGHQDNTLTIDYFEGWLESMPTINQVGDGYDQVSQTWKWGKWIVGDDGLYDVLA